MKGLSLADNALICEIYSQLRTSAGRKNFSKEQSEKALRGDCFDVMAFLDDQAVGMGRVIGDGVYYLMVDVVVRPDYQGNGIGKRMTEHIVNSLFRDLPAGAKCSVQLIAETGKEPFYEN